MRGKISNLVLLGMLVGVLLGGLLGYYAPSVMLATSFVGRLFLNALRIMMVPLLITSLVVGVSSLGGTRRIGRMAAATISYYLVVSIIAALIGLVAVQLLGPGDGLNAPSTQVPAGIPRPEFATLTDFLATLIPDNPVVAIVQGHLFGHVLLALFLGGILVTLGPRGRTAIHFFHELREALFRLVTMLLKVAPIGLLSLVGTIVAQNPESVSGAGGNLAMYTVTMVIALLVYAGIVLPLILMVFGKQTPLAFLGNMMPALTTAFATSSTAAALPVTYQCLVEKNKVDSRAGNLVLPFGAMVNMGATSLYLVVATLFIAQAFNVDLGVGQLLLVVVASVLLTLTVTGLPSAAFLTVAGVLAIADFPPQAYAGLGLILLVDWIIDRFRVKASVWGDAVGAAVVARFVEQSAPRPGEFAPRDSSGQDRPRRMDRPQGRPPDRQGDREGFRRDRQFGGRPDDRGPRRDGSAPRRDRPNDRRRDFDHRSPFAVADKAGAVIEGEHVEVESMSVAPTEEPTRTEESPRTFERPHGDRDRDRNRDRDREGDRGRDRDRGRGRRDNRPQRPRRDQREPREHTAPLPSSENQPTDQQELPGFTSVGEPEVTRGTVREVAETSGSEQPRLWLGSDESEDTEVTRAGGESAERDDEAEADSGPREVSYGRTRHRRFERPHTEESNDAPSGESSQPDVSPEPAESAVPEGPIEFGRARRKRTR